MRPQDSFRREVSEAPFDFALIFFAFSAAQVSIQSEKGRLKISGKEFRRLLGYDLLRSTNFVVKESNGIYHFSGLGWGHGVGLCQWGAKGMAEAGADYRSILKYYYQEVEIGKFPR